MMLNERKITMKTGERIEDREYANKEALKLMNEIGEKIEQSRGETYDPHQALKDYSREQLVQAIEEYDSQWGFLDYIHNYETDYWLNFTADLIEAGKIEPHYWASRMPQQDPYPELIETFVERLKNKHLNLTEKELATAVLQAKQKEEKEPVSILDELRKKAK